MAECRNHEGNVAQALCSRCGDLICALCAVSVAPDDTHATRLDYCPTCVLAERADAVTFGPYIPWEHRRRLGTLRAAWETVVASFSRPKEFYERMPMEGGYTDPLLFGMLMRGLVVVVYAFVIASFYLIVGAATREPMMFFQAGIQVFSSMFSIIQAAVLLFMMAGFLHLAVLVLAGGKGFERSFRVYSYGRAIDVLELIPLFGLLASALYRIYLHFLGFRVAHKLSDGQAIGIAVLPIAIWLGLVLFIVGLAVVIVLLVSV